MRRKTKFSQNELRALYNKKKLSISEIAKVFGCSYWTIWKAMQCHGIKARSLSEANKIRMASCRIDIPRPKLENLYLRQRMPTPAIAKLCACHHSTIQRRMKELGIRARSLSEAMTIYPKQNFSGDFLEKAYLIGFGLGDLHVRKINKGGQTIRIECSTTQPKQLELFRNLFEKYGHIHTYEFTGFGKETRIGCNLNRSFDFLLDRRKTIDTCILENEEYFFAFLAGYVDAEGYISTALHQAGLVIGCCDKLILQQAWKKLNALGIPCPKPRLSQKRGYVTAAKPLPYRKDYWVFGVYSKESLLKLFNKLFPYLRHENKLSDMRQALKNIGWRNKTFGNLRMEV